MGMCCICVFYRLPLISCSPSPMYLCCLSTILLLEALGLLKKKSSRLERSTQQAVPAASLENIGGLLEIVCTECRLSVYLSYMVTSYAEAARPEDHFKFAHFLIIPSFKRSRAGCWSLGEAPICLNVYNALYCTQIRVNDMFLGTTKFTSNDTTPRTQRSQQSRADM